MRNSVVSQLSALLSQGHTHLDFRRYAARLLAWRCNMKEHALSGQSFC